LITVKGSDIWLVYDERPLWVEKRQSANDPKRAFEFCIVNISIFPTAIFQTKHRQITRLISMHVMMWVLYIETRLMPK